MTRKTNIQQQDIQQRITIYIGYGLFLLIVIAFITDLLFWKGVNVDGSAWYTDFNSALLMIVAGLATIIPPLGGYIFGYMAAKQGSKQIRQYNGVLFGVLGYWLVLSLIATTTFLTTYTTLGTAVGSAAGATVANSIPVLIALTTVCVVAIAYGRRKNIGIAVLRYFPYRIVLMICVALLFVLSGVSIAVSTGYSVDFLSSLAVFSLPVVMVIGLILFGAWLIGAVNGSWWIRIAKSLIAMSFSFATIAAISKLLWPNQALASWSVVAAIIVWVTYITLLRRYPSTEK